MSGMGTVRRRNVLRTVAGGATAAVGASLFDTARADDADRATDDAFEIGAARVEASPLPKHLEEGVYLGGFGIGPTREATGVADGCWARAIAISADRETAVLAMLDLVGLGNTQLNEIRRRAAERTGVDETAILVGASHSHSGPDFQGLWGGVPRAYREFVVEKTVEAIARAVDDRRPATAQVGSVDAPEASSNRRGWESTTETLSAMQFVERVDDDDDGEDDENGNGGGPPWDGPPGPIGDAIDIATGDGSGGGTNGASGPDEDGDADVIATLVSYAAHPTVIGSDNELVATDYVGPLERALEERHGGVGVFFPGAIGDASASGASGETDFEQAQDYGETLADLADDALAESESVPAGMLVRTGSVRLPMDNCLFRAAHDVGFLRPYYDVESPTGTALSSATRVVDGLSGELGGLVDSVADLVPDVAPQAVRSPIARLSLGTAETTVELVTIPGEAVTRLADQLFDVAAGDHHFLLGLTQNSLGYLVREDEFGEVDDPYEETVSFGPDTAPIYRNGVRRLYDLPAESFERSDLGDRTCPATQAQLEELLAELDRGEMSRAVCCRGDEHADAGDGS